MNREVDRLNANPDGQQIARFNAVAGKLNANTYKIAPFTQFCSIVSRYAQLGLPVYSFSELESKLIECPTETGLYTVSARAGTGLIELKIARR